jgi:hypothetical protein
VVRKIVRIKGKGRDRIEKKVGRWETALFVFCFKYCWDEKFNEVACCLRRGNDEKAIKSFVGKPTAMEPLGVCVSK